MSYDENDRSIEITGFEDIKIYIAQNESQEVKRRRSVREALRALDVPPTSPLSLSTCPFPAILIPGQTSLLDFN
jgi:hypothetical protein